MNVDRMKRYLLKGKPDEMILVVDYVDSDNPQQIYDQELDNFKRAMQAKHGPHVRIWVEEESFSALPGTARFKFVAVPPRR